MFDSNNEVRKKLVFILTNLGGGGAERVLLNLLRYLNPSHYEITLFLLKNEGVYWDEIPKHVQMVFGQVENRPLRFAFFKILWRLLQTSKPADLIVAGTETWPTYFGVIAAKILRKKSVAWVHIDLKSYLKQMRFHYIFSCLFYPLASHVVCVSKGVEESFQKLFGKRTRISCIYNILDKETFLNKINQPLDSELPQVTGEEFICSIGRLVPQKNFELLIYAYAQLKNRGHSEKLIIAGEGEERSSLKKLIASLGLQKDVFLLGFVKNVPALLKQAVLFVLPSRFEGLVTVLLEAMALKIPVVSSDCPYGPREILQDGQNGILFENENVNDLVEKMDFALSHTAQMKEMAQNAYRRTEDFSYPYIIPQWENLFDEVLK